MNNRLYIIFVASLLFMAIAYAQIIVKVIVRQDRSFVLTDNTGNAEEPGEKNSNQETEREIDQDEDSFNLSETIFLSVDISLACSENENYLLGLSGFCPEVVAPPPQI
jgi:hypothetical protein